MKEPPFAGQIREPALGIVKISVVCVDTDKVAGRAKFLPDGLGMAAASGCAIDNGTGFLNVEEGDRFRKQDGLVAMIGIIHSRMLQRFNRNTLGIPAAGVQNANQRGKISKAAETRLA